MSKPFSYIVECTELRQGNTLNVDNIFMQWNVPLIDKIIIDMSCCLLAVSLVTMVPMVTRRCELYFDQQCVWGRFCRI